MDQAGNSDLQFDKAEFKRPEVLACRHCKRALNEPYFTANGIPFCQSCTADIRRSGDLTFAGFVKAAALGLGAAIVGAGVWAGIRDATGKDFGLVAIGVGLLIGSAVKMGSGSVGGWKSQLLAMALTYLAISLSLVITVFVSPEQLGIEDSTGKIAMAITMFFVGPVLASASLMGVIINGIAFYEGWKLNKKVPIAILGPVTPNWLPEKLTPDEAPGVVAGA